MIHTYSLVHDDLPAMDDDDLRRGLPTCHRKFGEAMAILVGDGLQALAFQVLASEYPPRVAASACRELAIAAGPVGMVGGQVDDLSWEGRIDAGRNIDPDIDHLERIHLRKTGALFGACLRIGQIVAEMAPPDGVDIAKRRCLDDYGRCLGLLFQITDDLLDANGSEAATGKRVGKDAARGKLTYPGLLGIDESRRRAESVAAGAIAAIQPLGANADPLGNLVVALISRDR
jgi:geranylgeranyl diphosphate synthase type II